MLIDKNRTSLLAISDARKQKNTELERIINEMTNSMTFNLKK